MPKAFVGMGLLCKVNNLHFTLLECRNVYTRRRGKSTLKSLGVSKFSVWLSSWFTMKTGR